MSDGTTYDVLSRAFHHRYGRHPDGVWAAPGRVNLIGEHTDYNEGLVLPFALHQRTFAAVAARDDDLLRVASMQHTDEPPVEVVRLAPGMVEGWAAYVAGVVWGLRADGHRVAGLDVLVDGRVPVGAGLSSSAALECAVALAAADLAGLPVDRAALARVAQRAENEFVGAPCGVMDQMASMTCRAGEALLFDVRSGDTTYVPFVPGRVGLTLLVVDTKVQHSVGDGAYGDRRAACERAAKALGVASLRDVDASGVDDALRQVAEGDGPRVRHVVTEIARVPAAASALREQAWARFGELMTASHVSLRDDYEVSCPELDLVVDTALDERALGARMTGAGFGGSAIALLPAAAVDGFTSRVDGAFRTSGFVPPTVFAVEPSDGARRLA